MNDWGKKSIKDLTLDDAMNAMGSGISLVCGDGRIKAVTFEGVVRW